MTTSTLRELDARTGDGIEVTLLWNEAEDSTFVHVTDARTGDEFEIPTSRALAWDVFQHPYAYRDSAAVPAGGPR
jgi:hypothetical protein